MPGGVNLHIRTRSSRSTRVLPLSGVAFRVGPGRQCEVRLDEGGPADVQCLLRRRGETWHVQPVARDGGLSLGGKALESPRPFPLGVPLRVGEHYLTLLPPDPVSHADEPILIDGAVDEADVYVIEAEAEPLPSAGPAQPEAVADPVPEPAAQSPGSDRPTFPPREADPAVSRVDSAAWEARLRQRERWLSDRKREGEWEARWKALGENLRASAEARAAEIPAPSPRAPHRPRARPKPTPPPPARERVLRIVPEPVPDAPRPERVVAPPRIYQGAEEAVGPPAVPDLDLPPILLCLPAPAARASLEFTSEQEFPAGAESRAEELLETPAILSEKVEATESSLGWPCLVAYPMLEHQPHAAQVAEATPHDEPASDFASPATDEVADESEELDPGVSDHPEDPAEDLGLVEDLADRLGLPVFQMGELSMEVARREPVPDEPAAVVAVDWGTVEIPQEDFEPVVPGPIAVEEPEIVAAEVVDEVEHRLDEPTVIASPLEEEVDAKTDVTRIDAPAEVVDVPDVAVAVTVEPVVVEAVREPERDNRADAIAPVTIAEAEPLPEDPASVARPKGPWSAPGPRRVEGMPSASSILAAGAARRAEAAGTTARRPRAEGRWPRPSVSRRPSQWSIPGATWYGIPAAIAATLIGGLMVHQAFQWALADRDAGALADRLARLQGVASPDPRALEGLANSEASLPDPSWTRSTSAEIAVRVAALARAGLDPVREERVVALLDAGRHVAPAQPAIRYALAWRSSQMGEGEALGSRLGLSRDVATLAWSARQLLDAGETGPALALYKEALGIAGLADLDHLERPSQSDQPQVRRFQMPYESLASIVLRDLIDARPWGLDDWESALTGFAPIPLAAARLLRERGSPDADRAMQLAIEAASAPPPEGSDPAVHLAAGAEAMALAGRWADAEALYREALEALGAGGGSTEVWLTRCWHYNLADLYTRLGEPSRATEALRLALGKAPNDEITRLIMRAQHQDGIALYDGAATPASYSPKPAGSPNR